MKKLRHKKNTTFRRIKYLASGGEKGKTYPNEQALVALRAYGINRRGAEFIAALLSTMPESVQETIRQHIAAAQSEKTED